MTTLQERQLLYSTMQDSPTRFHVVGSGAQCGGMPGPVIEE